MQETGTTGEGEIVTISEHGDLLLLISHKSVHGVQEVRLRVSCKALSATSRYFERALSNDRFGEAIRVSETHARLRSVYGDASLAPVAELPVLSIEHVGRISSVKSISALLTDFFHILHRTSSQSVLPITNLANLAIVADRFDALSITSEHFHRKKAFQAIDGKTKEKQDAALSIERIRQRLLAGLLLDHSPWTEKYSTRLVTRAREQHDMIDSDALWWDLPGRIDEEIEFRRECALRTIQDLQAGFLNRYCSRVRQCRLGYDSSAQCDSFQLGEMVKFFVRNGTLKLQGALDLPEADGQIYQGDLFVLIEQLRQVPEYQIDQNHSHCGIRTRLIPALSAIAHALSNIGICGQCWHADRDCHSWLMTKRPLQWQHGQRVPFSASTPHQRRHELVRCLFMADERVWD